MKPTTVLTLFALCAIGAVSGASSSAQPRLPNIIVILADDLGYGDLGAFGAPNIRTPRLDAMAAEGQKWTELLCAAGLLAQPRGAPHRATARPQRHVRHARGDGAEGVSRQCGRRVCRSDELTVAEVLKSAGYTTGMVGKWHLGQLPQFLPTRQGFDSWFGLPFSHDMRMTAPRDKGWRSAAYYEPRPEYWDVPLMRNGETIERPVDHRTLTKRYTEEAVRFIGASKDRPFFLYLAHSLPHIPLARSDAFVGHSAGGIYGDVVEELDWSVGQVIDAVRAAGIERNTLILFTSDNGPWLPFGDHGGSAGPLREGKGTTWEGGVRTPAIFWWPGTIQPGVVTGPGVRPRSHRDRRIALRRRAAARPRDGRSRPEPRASRDGPQPPKRAVLLLGQRAARDSQGPLQGPLHHQRRLWRRPPRTEHPVPLLFDLALDPGEQRNIAAAHPEIVADLVAAAAAHRRTVTPARPLFDELLPTPR